MPRMELEHVLNSRIKRLTQVWINNWVIIMVLTLIILPSLIESESGLSYNQNSSEATDTQESYESFISSPSGTRAGSHTVFAEDFTAEWCVYCPSASENLKEVYNDGNYDFYFVCMITQNATQETISEDAISRAEEMGISSYPTVEFDGGYVEVVGGQSDDSNYNDAIETCNIDRDIPDIDIVLIAEHIGSAKIGIDVDVTNNGESSYSGTLRVYIVEIVSRYFDYDGNHYPFGFLEYAIDEEITVSNSETTSRSTTWDGSKSQDGLGNDFSDIDPENIIIYATIMNSENTPLRNAAHTASEHSSA